MTVARVQAVGNAGVGVSSLSVGSGQGWATPTSGNLIVVTANSDATVTGPTGFTAGPSVIDGNGAYFWWKVSAGTETTITVTPSSAANTAITCAEYSGLTATPLDTSNSSTIAGSSGTTTTSTSQTTTASGDLLVGAALLHGYSGSAPTSPTWTNSWTNVLSPSSGSGVATHVTTFYADLIVAGAAGAYATSASWTNAASDRQEIVMAFLAASGTSISVSDAGSGADAVTTTAAAPVADSGTGADAMSTTAAVPVVDTASAADAAAVAASVPLTNTGTAADSLAVAAAMATADTGSGAEILGVLAAIAQADAASALDALTATATAPLTEAGTAADALSVVISGVTLIQLADTGSARDCLDVVLSRPTTGTTGRPATGTTTRPNTGVTC